MPCAGYFGALHLKKNFLHFLLQIFRGSAAASHYRWFDANTIKNRNKLVKNKKDVGARLSACFPYYMSILPPF